MAFTADVGKEEDVAAAFKAVVDGFGRLDILVSNAGVFYAARDGKVDDLPKAVWTRSWLRIHGHVSRLQVRRRRDQGDGGGRAVVITGSPTAISA
jgi:NAD(P)-dependent dehydrogenase (short-subunit alcohol dehydrogenase family)